MTCPLRRIILGYQGITSLVFQYTLGNEKLCIRELTDFPNAGDRNALGGIAKSGNRNYYPCYKWQINAILTQSDMALFERYMGLYTGNDSTIFTLQDENELVLTNQAGWHSRTIVPSSTVTLNGLTMAYYSFNVMIKIEQGQYLTHVGANSYQLKGVSFLEFAS
jgi:hypothetical protein